MGLVHSESMVSTKEVVPQQERELIERAKRDAAAFAIVYRLHVQAVGRYVYRRTGDLNTTEELVSNVFFTALKTLPRFRYRGVPLRHWLLRIATNEVNNWARLNRRRHSVPWDGSGANERTSSVNRESGVSEDELAEARVALLSLSPKYQAVLALHYFEGLPVREVASILGLRVGTVKSQLTRAREKLRDALTRGR